VHLEQVPVDMKKHTVLENLLLITITSLLPSSNDNDAVIIGLACNDEP